MTALVIPSSTTYGGMNARGMAFLNAVNEQINRSQSAIATAASGYTGVDGTEFEGAGNNFGVVADPSNAGAQGKAYRSAMGNLAAQWATFWAAAAPYIQELDQGVTVQP